ncbi:hypothetical protein DY000_02063236 [Brassica cretica]|uniref:Uncharacterized protein n=1 Tax=Brassica cretica TaxID=69181 RepID=A0ABQ7AZX2_BRACR|nr:hypothetical protein DY000_02063236 [Brassica cretica]
MNNTTSRLYLRDNRVSERRELKVVMRSELRGLWIGDSLRYLVKASQPKKLKKALMYVEGRGLLHTFLLCHAVSVYIFWDMVVLNLSDSHGGYGVLVFVTLYVVKEPT